MELSRNIHRMFAFVWILCDSYRATELLIVWKETTMINPGMMMKLMNAKNTFESNHPKFAAFVSRFFMGGAITEGTIIEITITRPGEEPVSTNLKVQKSDLDLVEELKNLR